MKQLVARGILLLFGGAVGLLVIFAVGDIVRTGMEQPPDVWHNLLVGLAVVAVAILAVGALFWAAVNAD